MSKVSEEVSATRISGAVGYALKAMNKIEEGYRWEQDVLPEKEKSFASGLDNLVDLGKRYVNSVDGRVEDVSADVIYCYDCDNLEEIEDMSLNQYLENIEYNIEAARDDLRQAGHDLENPRINEVPLLDEMYEEVKSLEQELSDTIYHNPSQ